MGKLRAWFEYEPPFKTLIINIPVAVVLMFILSFAGVYLASCFFTANEVTAHAQMIAEETKSLSYADIFLDGAVIAPAIEEAQFRLLPFGILFLIVGATSLRESRWFMYLVIEGIAVTSLVFGYAHGIPNLLIQSFSGSVLAIIFLRYSNMGRDLFRGYIASALCHGSFNAAAIGLAFSFSN